MLVVVSESRGDAVCYGMAMGLKFWWPENLIDGGVENMYPMYYVLHNTGGKQANQIMV